MFEWLANAWRVPELRRRVLFTAGILAVYKLGSWLPAPGLAKGSVNQTGGSGTGISGLLNLLSAGGFSRGAIFSVGIQAYVTASIILQLLTTAIPSLERLQKEGEAGQIRINQYSRYLTVALAAVTSIGYAFLFRKDGLLSSTSLGHMIILIITLTAGAALLMWLGEQITKRGVGNGISIIIFASILSSAPSAISAWLGPGTSTTGRLFMPIVILAVVVAVVFVLEGQRRIPVQYARRQLGGRESASTSSTYMPLSVNMAGVIPVIFALAPLSIAQTVGSFKPSWNTWIQNNFGFTDWKYLLAETLLIFTFTFFYTSVVFNPVEQADNLRKSNGYIPGIRPGPPTAAYLDRVLTRLTFFGALFLAAVAVAPSIFESQFHFPQAATRFLGGTSVLIVVGVALMTMRQMESQMAMRHYEGFLR
jgi:preprotein translocase subunit SecY